MTRPSLSDEQLIQELEKGRAELLSGAWSPTLLSELRRRLRSITRNIYVIKWIPEQGEDLYDVLVDGVNIVHLEIPRSGQRAESAFQVWPVGDYMKARKDMVKPDRRKLEIALRLATAQRAVS